jgi:hypothetical protein
MQSFSSNRIQHVSNFQYGGLVLPRVATLWDTTFAQPSFLSINLMANVPWVLNSAAKFYLIGNQPDSP